MVTAFVYMVKRRMALDAAQSQSGFALDHELLDCAEWDVISEEDAKPLLRQVKDALIGMAGEPNLAKMVDCRIVCSERWDDIAISKATIQVRRL